MTTTDTARDQAQAQLDHIRELMEWMDHANGCDFESQTQYLCTWTNTAADEYQTDVWNQHNSDAATQAIHENALSVEVRSGWELTGMLNDDGEVSSKPSEYRILLCTGGPAVRITGELDEHSEPESAKLEYQDWGTPWTQLFEHQPQKFDEAQEILIRYAQQFYFGS